jgi:Tol biopolymer transport system component
MTLSPGTKLGPYEILAPLGAGGMGEVYRAKDTRLGREVAVKVLPQHLSANEEIRARFEREAKTVSSLNHPNICTLFDVGRAPGEAGSGETDYLVMELIEGDTLAERLRKGPLPGAELLRLGAQIADALDRAHRAGVIHRDLKPGNVMLTRSGAKLMDFGLARAADVAKKSGSGSSGSPLTQSPTVAQALTTEGSIVGTYQYMAPEQLEGHEADARSDIWAMGCVLYEMATGKRAFEGRSQATLIAAIIGSQPAPVNEAPSGAPAGDAAPAGLDRLIRACLAKDPEDRVQTAHAVKQQLQWIAEGAGMSGVGTLASTPGAVPAPLAARRGGSKLAWGVAAAALLAAVALAGQLWREGSETGPSLRFEIRIPASLAPLGPLRLSPDGRMAAFAATDSSGAARLWLRTFDDLECHALPGTEGAGRPFWSPDSRALAFFSGGKLRKILVTGGRPETICDAPGGSDGCWTRKGQILFDGDGAHPMIRMVPATGGEPHAITVLDTLRHEIQHGWPEALPDGRHYLYGVTNSDPDKSETRLGEIGSTHAVRVTSGDSRVEFAPSGHLLFEREGALLAQRLSVGSGKLTGEPRTLVDQVGVNRANAMPFFSCASGADVLLYSQARGSARRIVWVDRTGRAGEQIGPNGAYGSLALSPDGKRLAYELADASGQAGDLWVRDLERGISSRFTIDPANDMWPVWGPDSRTLYWTSNRAGAYSVYRRSLDSVGSDSLVYKTTANVGPVDASRDGRYLACMVNTNGAWDAIAVPLAGGAPVPIAATKFAETRPHFSPDGRWVAYDSDQSGLAQAYVQAFPGPGAPVQISSQGGGNPYWSADGTQLFYRSLTQDLMVADVKTGERFEAGASHLLFNFPLVLASGNVGRYAPAADGQRFLFCAPLPTESAWMPIAVLGWARALRK